ncbi:beta-glucosidase BglX [Arcticibacterium luteifluviistationis]|uniref:Beta-glucosidase BglX n=1 Tax=Arcticibacterium luteifluviistationis TaxID=1784714 RepID=A0A2Z4GDL8_9BACT|nr:beta-glucosidase BglX [Arcticibacterium luteifluviistationis]AWV99336.1 beta-glucosidase BglX [Arcticibacterium luteifluviistationis]
MKKLTLSLSFALLAIASFAQSPYKNASLSDEARIADLLSRMTVEEKVGQLNQVNGGVLTGPSVANDPGAQGKIQLLKDGMVGSFLNVVGTEQTLATQKIAVEQTRLGIPLLFAFDVIHGYKTVFPIPLAEAASWDLAAAEKSASIAAKEASSAGLHWTFAPMMDMSREPRWGRVMEGSGEDPYLQGKFAAARVKGFQGNFDENHVLATIKHFAAYGAVEAGREYNTVDVSRYALWNYYLPSYKAAVDAGAATVMNSFNFVDGVPASGNDYLVNKVLRDKWGFDGMVVSDWASFGEMMNHGYSKDAEQAAIQAIMAGSDMDMEAGVTRTTLVKSVKDGVVPMAVLDEAVSRVLALKFKLGLFDNPYKYHDAAREKATLMADAHLAEARKAAGNTMTLLKNSDGVLPLNSPKNILVLGHLAESQDDVLDFWKGQGEHKYTVTILEGIKAKYPKANVTFIRSVSREGDFDASSVKEMKKAAKKADVIIATIGLFGDLAGEARSLSDVSPSDGQMEMLANAKATGKPVVVLVQAGRPMIMTDVVKDFNTVLYTWIGGTQHGHGVVDVLSGDVNPSAKTVMSFPVAMGQIPVYYNHYNGSRPHVDGNEGPEHFWVSRYRDIPNEPLYPFGYGLSYSSYEYSGLKISKSSINQNESVTVSVNIKNTSGVDGTEIVQLYIRDLVSQPVRPVKELKDFARVEIAAGKSKTVTFELPATKLSFFDQDGNVLLQKGAFKVFVGTNSRDVLAGDLELR